MTLQNPVTSQLWKFVQLTTTSTYFPLLVQGAALFAGKTYTPSMLRFVAAQDTVLGAISLEFKDGVSEPVDPVLERLMVDSGPAVDSVILSAVQAFTPDA